MRLFITKKIAGKGIKSQIMRFAILLSILFLLIWACGGGGGSDSGQIQYTPTLPNEGPDATPYSTVVEEFSVVSPSGNRLYGLIRRPDPQIYPYLSFAAVIIMPGGVNPGRMLAYEQDVITLAEAGMVVATYNAQGRVDSSPDDILSEGEQDYNGYEDQDGLCEVVNYIKGLPYVILDNVGIQSHSFGITAAAGCVYRHSEISVKYIVDGEGPSDSFVTAHEPWTLDSDPSNDKHEIVYNKLGHYSTYRDPSPENIAFWAEREAVNFIGSFRGRYLRLQAEWDHAQPPIEPSQIPVFHQPPIWWQAKHATDMVNAAVAGGVPLVRVNMEQHGNAVNATYDENFFPFFLPGFLKDEPWAVRAIIEMARME